MQIFDRLNARQQDIAITMMKRIQACCAAVGAHDEQSAPSFISRFYLCQLRAILQASGRATRQSTPRAGTSDGRPHAPGQVHAMLTDLVGALTPIRAHCRRRSSSRRHGRIRRRRARTIVIGPCSLIV